MNSMPKRRTKVRMNIRPETGDIPQHRQWVRGHACSVTGCCNRDIEAAHVRVDIPPKEWFERSEKGGTSKKPHDKWCIPLCSDHHKEQHRGERTFSVVHKLDTHAIAAKMWATWPKRREYELEHAV